MFKDGAIYLSPDQDNEKDLLDDIYELAHAVEKKRKMKYMVMVEENFC